MLKQLNIFKSLKYISVYLGINNLYSDTLARFASALSSVELTFIQIQYFFCYSFQCAYIIKHFWKCFSTLRLIFIIVMEKNASKSQFMNSFNSTTQLKGRMKELVEICSRSSAHEPNLFSLNKNESEVNIFFFSWFFESTKIYGTFILTQLLCSLIALACATFELDQVINDVYFHRSFIQFITDNYWIISYFRESETLT